MTGIRRVHESPLTHLPSSGGPPVTAVLTGKLSLRQANLPEGSQHPPVSITR